MDMKKILSNFDDAATGKKPSAATAEKNSMKAILESFNRIEECGGMMPSAMPESDPVSMNVTLNARGKDAIEDLIGLMNGAKAERFGPAGAVSSELPMSKLISIAADEHEPEDEMDEDERYQASTSPDEEYGTMQDVIASGTDLNKAKSSSPATAGGDNPLALQKRLKEELSAAWKKTVEEVTEKRSKNS